MRSNRFLGAILILLGCHQALADDDFTKEIVKSTPLTQSLYMLEGAGGNFTALIGQDGTFLVDDDFAPMAEKLLNKLKELKGASPRYIVNTHFHFDHTGSLAGYAKNVKRVIDQISDDYKIVPGHGPLSKKVELEKYQRMILASIETVRKGIKAGRTLEQIQKTGLAAEWESFSHGYLTTDRWLALVYDNLKN